MDIPYLEVALPPHRGWDFLQWRGGFEFSGIRLSPANQELFLRATADPRWRVVRELPRIFDARIEGELVCIQSAYGPGARPPVSLDRYLRHSALLGAEDAAQVFLHIACSVGVVHAAGLVHGGLTPDRIALRPEGILLLDAGLAPFLNSFRLNSLAGRSADIFWLGVIGRILLTGRLSDAAPSSSHWLADVVAGCLSLELPSVQAVLARVAGRYAARPRESWVARMNRGIALASSGSHDEASALLEEAARSQDWLALYNLGVLNVERGRYEDAVELFRHVIAYAPKHAPAYYHLGRAYLALGRLDQALEEFQKSLMVNPGAVDTLRGLAQVYRLKGQDAQAQDHLQRSRELDEALPLYQPFHLELDARWEEPDPAVLKRLLADFRG